MGTKVRPIRFANEDHIPARIDAERHQKARRVSRTILVVEDDFLVALDITQLLESHGWVVIGPAPSVKVALDLLDAGLPSAALLDVNLGKEMVTPVAEALKLAGVPFAVASAYEKPEQFGGPVLTGAPTVGKPIKERRLLAALAQL